MEREKGPDNVNTIAQAITKVSAIIALIAILYIDAHSPDIDAKDIELILSGYIAGAEALQAYRKVKK